MTERRDAEVLLDVTRELYQLDPADFVGVRTERAKQARADGKKQLAATIGKLRKPTLVAWALNITSNELADDVRDLLELGDALRDATNQSSGAELRKLTTRRQQAVRAMAESTAEVAAERGHPLGEGAQREVAQTLHAALADPQVATDLSNGRLVTSATYSGFGPAGLTVVAEQEPTAEQPPPVPTKAAPDRAGKKAALRDELAEATAALDKARDAADAANAEADEASTRVDDIATRISELRDELDRAEQERQFARSAERAAADALRKAERDVERAFGWVRKTTDALDALD